MEKQTNDSAMLAQASRTVTRLAWTCSILIVILLVAVFAGLSAGSSGGGIRSVLQVMLGEADPDSMMHAIIWQIRLPRVLLATLVGATLSLGGLVFQALLKNLLAEPYILGISGGSAIGAILGILLGLTQFPGVSATAFIGSMVTLALILVMTSGQSLIKKESLLLSGVMINAFCSSVIMFLVSITQDARLHNIIFWLMGDLSTADIRQVAILACMLVPCYILIFWHSHAMNILLMGRELAQATGISIKTVTITLMVTSTFMVSATVGYCGLIGFVGLVMPHLLRLIVGPDHRVLVPACILGGGSYLVICDLLARILPGQGEMPAGVITALIGAPIFIILLKRSET